jgi:predicted dehydrogenase
MGTAVAQVVQRDSRVKLTAFCNHNSETLAKTVEIFDVKGYENYLTMLDAEQPDITFIATPDWAHFDAVMACLDRRIHVYVEKPLTTDAAKAEVITKRVEETGLKLQVSYNHRWLAPYNLTHQKILSGEIGQGIMSLE